VLLRILAPDEAHDPALLSSFAEYERQSVSPGMAAAMLRLLYEGDVRDVLPAIRVPTLVISHRDSARIPADSTRYLAERIPDARLVELPGNSNLIWAGDQEAVVAEIQEFFTGVRPQREARRMLATILFTDIVGSTAAAAELGDARWRAKLEEFDEVVKGRVEDDRGRWIKNTGDGGLATFDGPARAIHCAGAIRHAVDGLGLSVRSGLHAGEVEVMGHDIGGIAVHIGARIAALAGPGEILVSRTMRDLVVGSEIDFADRGEQELRGVPGEWRLYAVNQNL
jgi:class 3 adenylate cyclase